MKVYVKKEEKNTMIPGIVLTVVFLSVSLGVFIAYFRSDETFLEKLSSFGIELLFALVFLVFGVYFVYALIKSPKAYNAKLINKKKENYNGKEITYMEFSTQKEDVHEDDFVPDKYKCYTNGDNELIVGNNYSLRIKEFNWQPKYVEEINDTNKCNITTKVPTSTMTPVFFSIGLIFGGSLFLCILGFIFYPQYRLIYLIVGIFEIVVLFSTVKASKTFKADNSNVEQLEHDLNLKLEKVKPLSDRSEKIGNMVIKDLLIVAILIPVIWFIVIMNTNTDIINNFTIFALPTLFFEILIIVMILYNIGYDERLIKKNKVKVTENINFSSMKTFNIFRATKNMSFQQYFIVDQNKNLVLKIKKSNFIGNKFVICNSENIKIGEIKRELFSLTNEFIINIIDEPPFIVRSKMQFHSNYQVIGRDYYVKGDTQLIRNVIFDNNDKDIAYISAVSKNNNNWYELGNTEIILNDDVINSIGIMIIALCITMGNFNNSKERHN